MEKLNIINQLLNEIQTISESYKRVAEATGENFNIFSVLQMESDEVKTHSRFLAELLNPKGSHGQKDVFLRKFVERFEILGFETENAEVFVEFYIGEVTLNSGGRIDILVRNKSDVVMIENKIYANEQPNQLTRYRNYSQKGKLFYLTLDGKESKDKNIDKDDYECISYENDILNWLDECKKESVNTPILRETITQYINLIKTLTGQNINIKMSQDIAKRILKDKESFEAYQNLLDSEKEVRQQVLNEIFPDLIKSVKINHKLESNDISELFNENIKWRSVSFTNESLKMLGLSICFSFNFERNFYGILYGFRYETNSLHNKKLEIIKKKFDEEFDIINFDNNWLCWNSLDRDKSNSNLETLKNIKFGNFKFDFEEKVKAMLSIIDSIKETKE